MSQWAEQLKEEYSKIAKENQATSTGGKKPQLSLTLDEAEKIDSNKQVANDLDMGTTTYKKAKYIYEDGNNELIQQLDDEELHI
ncbi:hypothetical protein K8O96_03240 [Clostridium sporogenes]|uniref:Uncharacterized protein n=1 Tax=Clostridium botulinum TaxID=1491 RepID=A0A6M0SZD9_CLOBO|nr:hypothetical protein [Clostridium sporogenes]NFA60856.1 hypothetical protein [Clostridium botulinum]NFI72471.1 hypothetical protein [Clostridium sporogenes]NFL73350.1 hypothetical protein [Clostridium sporogenes]NFM23631.1 hypothetical protein [Clostridium sporogenes]NFP60681.1 hypothetical protein [Clostridium sporogenes]